MCAAEADVRCVPSSFSRRVTVLASDQRVLACHAISMQLHACRRRAGAAGGPHSSLSVHARTPPEHARSACELDVVDGAWPSVQGGRLSSCSPHPASGCSPQAQRAKSSRVQSSQVRGPCSATRSCRVTSCQVESSVCAQSRVRGSPSAYRTDASVLATGSGLVRKSDGFPSSRTCATRIMPSATRWWRQVDRIR